MSPYWTLVIYWAPQNILEPLAPNKCSLCTVQILTYNIYPYTLLNIPSTTIYILYIQYKSPPRMPTWISSEYLIYPNIYPQNVPYIYNVNLNLWSLPKYPLNIYHRPHYNKPSKYGLSQLLYLLYPIPVWSNPPMITYHSSWRSYYFTPLFHQLWFPTTLAGYRTISPHFFTN